MDENKKPFTAGFPPGVNTISRHAVGERLAAIRGARTHAEFSTVLGVHKNTYGGYERGESELGAEVMGRLMALGWNANWLLTGDGPELLAGNNRIAEDAASYGQPSQDLSAEHLSIALELTEEALRGKWLPKREYAEVVAGIYAMLTQGLPYADILDLTRSPAETKAIQGAGDGSRSEGGPAGEGANRRSGNG